MITLNQVSKSFRKKDQKKLNGYFLKSLMQKLSLKGSDQERITVLHEVSLQISPGERVAIIGRNKSGKTSLMHIIASITRPDSGKLMIEGKVVPIFGLGVGFSTLLTGRENLILNATSLGAKASWVKGHLHEIQEFAELDNLDIPLKFFSNGMKARLALAIAVFVESDILILDEVFDGLDVFFREKVLSMILESAERTKRTLLVISHDEEILTRLCSSVIYLKKGRVMESGGMELIQKYKTELN